MPSCLTRRGAKHKTSVWKPGGPCFREIVRAEARGDPPEDGDMTEVRALARYTLTMVQTAETEALIWESLARNQLMDVAESSNLARQLLAALGEGGLGESGEAAQVRRTLTLTLTLTLTPNPNP